MSGNQHQPPDGELRMSQVITTFGPGAMLDLPEESVLVGGLDHWYGEKRLIREDRLVQKVREVLRRPNVSLREPPPAVDDTKNKRTGISVYPFPRWYVAQGDWTWTDPRSGVKYRTRPLIPHNALTKGQFIDRERKKHKVVPVRFVRACNNGHIRDIDWFAFVFNDFKAPKDRLLWLDEGGAGNDFSQIFVRVDGTNQRRALAQAKLPNVRPLGKCPGIRPWLGAGSREDCDEDSKLLVRSASNAYFPQTLGVISIPDADEELRKAVDLVYDDFLSEVASAVELDFARKMAKVKAALEGWANDVIMAEIERRKTKAPAARKSIKQTEIETFMAQPESAGEDVPESDFYARRLPHDKVPAALHGLIERVVLVHRLREVIAQVGFTRFDPALPDIDGELRLDVKLAELARDEQWVPAVENRGEGVLIVFKKDAIDAWLGRTGVAARDATLQQAFAAWQAHRGTHAATYPGLPFYMLHSLAHLLITAVSLSCGYGASSIRERIYARESGYAILLYTASSGSEGTLGGLVEVGRKIGDHLLAAVRQGRLCGNDPVCAQHQPNNANAERFLHGAACHGCVLIPETCCEARNEFLDRSLVVPTVTEPDAAFLAALT